MANLPPQLSRALGDAAASVEQFAELAPGIPWSPQILDGLYDQLLDKGGYEVTITTLPGYAQVTAAITCEYDEKGGEPVILGFLADVLVFRGIPDTPHPHPHEHPYIPKSKCFPNSKQGLKDAFDFLKESVNQVARTGFCDDCLALERPRKRLRIQGADVCGECLLKKAIGCSAPR